MKKLFSVALAATAFITVPAAAQTTILTFDGLTRTYGDGQPLGDGVTGDSQTLSYAESGYVFTLHTANDPNSGFFGAHIGDAGTGQTFNYHDDGDNLVGAYVTLSKIGGGLFNLNAFDYSSYGFSGQGLTVSADGYKPLFFAPGASETATPGFLGVSTVTFASSGYTYNQLDNVSVSAAGVPEPATWAMMLMGFGLVGAGLRTRRSPKVATRVAYA